MKAQINHFFPVAAARIAARFLAAAGGRRRQSMVNDAAVGEKSLRRSRVARGTAVLFANRKEPLNVDYGTVSRRSEIFRFDQLYRFGWGRFSIPAFFARY